MTSTPYDASTSPEATAVAHDLIASFGQDPDLYVPGTVSTLPGTRTTTYDLACGPRCPHRGRTVPRLARGVAQRRPPPRAPEGRHQAHRGRAELPRPRHCPTPAA